MPTARLGGIELYFEEHGQGTPVLLVSGLSGVGATWQCNIPGFSAHHRVIVHDQRGTGRSSRPRGPYSVEQLADDLSALMDHLGIDSAHFVGHSGGAAIGQSFALAHPGRLRSLTLYSGWTKADSYLQRVLEIRGTLLSSAGPEAFLRSGPVFFYPPDWVNRNIGSLQAREESAVADTWDAEIVMSRIDAFLNFDLASDLHGIRIPTLVICARDDILAPPYFSDELARMIPDAESVRLDYGGHFSSEANREGFEKAVLSFLRKQST